MGRSVGAFGDVDGTRIVGQAFVRRIWAWPMTLGPWVCRGIGRCRDGHHCGILFAPADAGDQLAAPFRLDRWPRWEGACVVGQRVSHVPASTDWLSWVMSLCRGARWRMITLGTRWHVRACGHLRRRSGDSVGYVCHVPALAGGDAHCAEHSCHW